MKKNFLIILNAVVYNRGSEALVRGISSICKKVDPESNITLISSEEEFGSWIKLDNIDNYCKKNSYSIYSLKRYITSIFRKMKMLGIVEGIQYSHLKEIVNKQDVIFIVGADNYDITYNMQKSMYRFNSFIRKHTKAKMILYDCSVDKRDITDILKKDLKNFDFVTVRESISLANLQALEEKVRYFPDPAFVMEPEKVKLPKVFENGKVIGVNVSNLITNKKYGSEANKILQSYKNMLDYILEKTNENIILIPHVMKGADLSALKVLYQNYEDNERVELITDESLNAKQIKYIISKCDMFVGARTHATIAAYSTCVPTLVLGYSVKSKGIAKDIFGTDESYVLPVSNLDSEEYLIEGFKWLYSNKNEIVGKLKKVMPEYIKKAENIKELIENI